MNKLKTLMSILKNGDIKKIPILILQKIYSKKINSFFIIKNNLRNKSGLEIGGSSWIFRDYSVVPIYKYIKSLDGCNYASDTIWANNMQKGFTYNFYGNKCGQQYICEATQLVDIPDEKYDFILSSNCLEHIANPIKAIEEWVRVLKHEGYLLLIVPKKELMFDHKRPTTTFDHLMADYNNNRGEDDMTHFNEIIELHDLNLDQKAGTKEQFIERSKQNPANRTLHHHVFDIPLLCKMLELFKIEILFTEVAAGNNIVFGKKN